MQLTAEQIQQNWLDFMGFIDDHISEPRKTKLKEFYETYEDRIVLMPAAHKKEYHNAFPGGYIEHVNPIVFKCLFWILDILCNVPSIPARLSGPKELNLLVI